MHRLFPPLIAPLIEAIEPRVIVETGSGSGRLTRKILDAPAAGHARVHAVDPEPSLDPHWVEEAGERLELHAQRAIGVIGGLGPVDLALLDGDPNWYSVHSELTMLIDAAERAHRPPPLLVVHNVHWPFGRRDGYYDPAAIPLAQRHEHSQSGLVPGRRDPCPEGLTLAPHCAVRDLEPRSGVLTAIEDMIAASDLDWTMLELPGFHGCAVLAEGDLLAERPAIAKVLDGLRASAFLGRQVRRAETARLEVEVELAAARAVPTPVEDEAFGETETETEEAVPEPPSAVEDLLEAQNVNRSLEAERLPLLGELADHRAQREALEWRLERLDGDIRARNDRIDALGRDRAEDRSGLVELRVRLEGATERLEAERAVAAGLRERTTELESRLRERERELSEVTEREQLARGRLSHREETLQATTADANRLRRDVDRLRSELRDRRALLDEVAEQLDRGAATRWSRLGRRIARIVRALTFRGPRPPDPYELARISVERAPPAVAAPLDPEGDAGNVPEGVEMELRRHG